MPQIAGKEIGPIGFGLMGFTWTPTPTPIDEAISVMRASLDLGANFWNGGEFYGTPEYNSLTLLNTYFTKYPEDAERVVLSIKGGVDLKTLISDGSAAGVRTALDRTLAQLPPSVKKIDMFEWARRDPKVPLAETFGVLKNEYIDTGKVGGISLSEVSADTIHEAVAVADIAAVELELSLFSTDILNNGIAAACGKYGIPIVAYSPMGRGMLTGQIRTVDDIPNDMRRHFPRFQPDALPINIKLADQVAAMAAARGVTSAQLALAWCRAQARRPGMPEIVPIPGTTRAARLEENCAIVELSDSEVAELDKTLSQFEVRGARYRPNAPINT